MREWRIAIVDDSRDAAKTLAELFGPHGVTPEIFTSCEELLERDEYFDAVVTDTDLGLGMSGFDCAGEIRKRMEGAVIVGTSVVETNRNDEYHTIYRRSGADDFININETADTIVERILSLLSNRQPST